MDADLSGLTIHPLRLVLVAMMSHCLARSPALLKGKVYDKYPCMAVLREARNHPHLVQPALSFLDTMVPAATAGLEKSNSSSAIASAAASPASATGA